MRTLTSLAALLLVCALAVPGHAEESLSESMTAKAKPLLKAFSLLGTPYKLGGNNPEKGIDCSGFVKHVYKESAGVSLPRTAREMSREGAPVAKEELQPGDLVFFNTRKRANSHVGIYAGNGEFVHASSSKTKQVTVSRMDQSYWANRYNGARRVLSAPVK